MLEPTFGGINLSGLRAPEGLYIYDQLVQKLNIPVFYENLYSSAVVAAAALLNALDLVEKKIGDIRVVISGIGGDRDPGDGPFHEFISGGTGPVHS